MSLDAMKQALEALERVPEIGQQAWQLRLDAIAALRLAIEQAERPYADKAALLNSDRLRIDPVTGNVGIGSVTQAERQEPVAWREFDGEGGYDYRTYDDNENFRDEYIKRNGQRYASWVEPLYAAPPQRQPLTEAEIVQVLGNVRESVSGNVFLAFARAIERKHGIGGEHD